MSQFRCDNEGDADCSECSERGLECEFIEVDAAKADPKPYSNATASCPAGVRLSTKSMVSRLAVGQRPSLVGTTSQLEILGCTILRERVKPAAAKRAHQCILAALVKNRSSFSSTHADMETGPGGRRLMLDIGEGSDIYEGTSEVLKQLEAAVRDVINDATAKLVKPTALVSLEGCERQFMHRDLDGNVSWGLSGKRFAGGVLLALDKCALNTSFGSHLTGVAKGWSKCHRVELGGTDALCFHASLVHGGCEAAEAPVIRIHAFVCGTGWTEESL